MKEHDIPIFRTEIKGVTVAELRMRPSTAVKAALLGLGITGIILGSRYVADFFKLEYAGYDLNTILTPTRSLEGSNDHYPSLDPRSQFQAPESTLASIYPLMLQ